jgi:hypothetical protein
MLEDILDHLFFLDKAKILICPWHLEQVRESTSYIF